MTTPSPSQPVFPVVLRVAGIASLLLAGIVNAQAVEDDEEDFNAIARKERDPYHLNDWRFGYTMLPASADISVMDQDSDANSNNFQRDTNWDLTGRTGLTWMTPLGGLHENGDFILGLELSTNHLVIDEEESNPEFDLRTYQLTIHPGLAWLLDEGFHIEVNPFASIGHAQYDLPIAGDGSSLYWEVGLRFAAFYTWDNGFQLGMQTGFLYGKTDGELEGGGATYDAEVELMGIFMGIQLGYRL
jgi:hypothetical protein